jgi:hypothetical protein
MIVTTAYDADLANRICELIASEDPRLCATCSAVRFGGG